MFCLWFGDCLTGSYVFRDWARRAIIQNSIHMLAPRKDRSAVADVIEFSTMAVPCGYAAWRILTGSDKVTTAPPPGRSETRVPPPCAWATASTNASPRP